MSTKKEMLEGTTGVVSSKIVERNTLRIEYENGNIAYRLHKTDVVTFTPDNKVILDSGGWRTPTTKERINKYAPQSALYQEKGVWYIGWGKGVPFYDGIVLDVQFGNVISEIKQVDLKEINQLKKKINKFVSLITKENLPLPGNGDCWLCLLRDKEGKTWGDHRPDDNDHLLNHIEEEYLHGSLLVNAMREYGYNDHQIGVHYQIKVVDTFKRALRRYLQKRLIKNISVK